jgi:hypothetical protein
MESKKKIGNLKKLNIKPSVIAGFESVGKIIESNELLHSVASLPEPALQFINWYEFTLRFLSMRGITVDGLIYTPEQINEMKTNMQTGEALVNASPKIMEKVL